ncbi:MAG TPA: helix-turn-helix domain-containing protein [Tepidisphaeraceae bacterium]|nr:helix-turn-helix domain-containing protein [Tepidisphaeraceae bacterium]
MMAKMFYTLDEAKTTLGKSEDEVKQLVRDGKLREFRDGPRLMFKADQVEQLKNEIAAGPAAGDPGSSGSGMVIGLSDLPGSGFGSGAGSGIGSGANRAASGSGSGAIAMAGSGLTGSGLGSAAGSGITGIGSGAGAPGSGQIGIQGSGQIGIQGSGAMSMNLKDDTALAADLGLSGSIGGTPSPGRGGTAGGISGSGSGSGSSGSRAGIDVFQADEVDRADPSAQTAINPSLGDQLNLEGVGSGSGLLDLTRESDDTSLGAELLDEIAPGGSKAGSPRSPAETGAIGSGMAAASGGPVTIQRGPALPTYERPDPWASALGAAALGAVGVTLFAAFALVTGILGTHPQIIQKLGGQPGFAMWQVAAAGVGVCALFFAVGYMVGGKAAR